MTMEMILELRKLIEMNQQVGMGDIPQVYTQLRITILSVQ